MALHTSALGKAIVPKNLLLHFGLTRAPCWAIMAGLYACSCETLGIYDQICANPAAFWTICKFSIKYAGRPMYKYNYNNLLRPDIVWLFCLHCNSVSTFLFSHREPPRSSGRMKEGSLILVQERSLPALHCLSDRLDVSLILTQELNPHLGQGAAYGHRESHQV